MGRIRSSYLERMAAIPAESFVNIEKDTSFQELVSLYYETLTKYQEVSSVACKSLFLLAGEIEDPEERRLIIRIKRNVFNGRRIGSNNIDWVYGIDPQVAGQLNDVCLLLDSKNQILKNYEEVFNERLLEERDVLWNKIQHPSFQKGILLSSQSVYYNQSRYSRRSHLATSKIKSLERGLLKYYSRASMKATPFSAFCNIIAGSLCPKQEGNIDHDLLYQHTGGIMDHQDSYINIDKTIYTLIRSSLDSDEESVCGMPVTVNPTYDNNGSRLSFISGSGITEVFRSIDIQPVITRILEIVRNCDSTVGSLVEVLCKETHEEYNTVAPFVFGLMKMGLLIVPLQVDEQDYDWVHKAKNELDQIQSKTALRAHNMLSLVDDCVCAYATAGVSERALLLKKCSHAIGEYLDGLSSSHSYRRTPLFEDCGTNTQSVIQRMDGDVFDELESYVDVFSVLSYPGSELLNMGYFLKDIIGRKRISLLEFYKRYYEEHFKEYKKGVSAHEKERAGKMAAGDAGRANQNNPFGLPEVGELLNTRKELVELFNKKWIEWYNTGCDTAEIYLNPREIEGIVRSRSGLRQKKYSASVFAQPFQYSIDGEQHVRLIMSVNGSFMTGHGKYYSRFLNMMPNSVSDGMDASDDSTIYCDIEGFRHLNINMHPQILSNRIRYPTSTSVRKPGDIECSDIDVVLDDPADIATICLRHVPSGRKIIPVDLGFVNIANRPPLYHLLNNFTPVTYFNTIVTEWINTRPNLTVRGYDPQSGFTMRPRVVYGDNLVLARKRWRFSSKVVPKNDAKETDQSYSFRILEWLRTYRIPREFYVRFSATGIYGVGSLGDDGELDMTHVEKYKPQYIDVESPLYLNLFAYLINRDWEYYLDIVERYPQKEQLPRVNDHSYTSELVLQVDCQ